MLGNFRKKSNQDWWANLDKAAEKHTISWEWVKGHSGHDVQEVADDIARKTAELGRVDEDFMDEAILQIGVIEI
jgi:ribonuclease HI